MPHILMFLSGLLLMPLAWWPWATIRFELPRVWFFNRWVEILAVFGLLSVRNIKKRRIDTRLVSLILVFLIVALVASVFGADPMKSFRGNPLRDDGLFTLFHLIGLSFFICLFWGKALERLTIRAIALSSIMASAWAVLDGIRFYFFHTTSVSPWGGAIGATFGQPVFLAGYLMVAFPFIFTAAHTQRGFMRLFWNFSILIQLSAIVLTRSWIGIGGAAAYLVWRRCASRQWGRKLFGAIVLVSGITIAILLILRWSTPIDHRLFIPESRERIVRSLWRAMSARPLTGWGWANVDDAFEYNPWPQRFFQDVHIDKAHNTLLEILMTTGIVGFILYSLIIIRSFHALRRTVFAAPLILYLLHAQTNVTSIASEALFWLMVGIAANVNPNRNS